MKIGVIGPESTTVVIKRVVEKYLPDIQLLFRCSEFYEEAAESAAAFQRGREVDAILFTGPTNYTYAHKRVAPAIPWGYLPHNRTAALEALLKAMALYGSDLRSISVDRYNTELLRDVLESVGIDHSTILRAPYDAEEPGFEKKLQSFHRSCYREGRVSVCLTSMEHIAGPLQAEGIPCIRIYPTAEVVQEQIYHLRILDLSARENQGRLAVISIHFDYSFDTEQNLMVREWEKMKYQNEFKENIYAIAQQMEATVFGDGLEHFFIVTSRSMLINVFLKNREHWNLLQFGRRSPEYKIWVGMGIGDTMLEARSRAAMALNRSIADQAGNSYLVENEDQVSSTKEFENLGSLEDSASYFARKVRTGSDTLEKLSQVIRLHGDTMTSQELAEYLGITTRSVNRIVLQLEDEGFITVVGKRSAGKGRPARIMKIRLPDVLRQ